MVNEEFTFLTLNDKPGLVVRKYWTSTMKFFDVKGACLGARRSKSNLYVRR
jgi:hypothetical protein